MEYLLPLLGDKEGVTAVGTWTRVRFTGTRPGGCGGYDLYISYREDTGDHLGWQPAEHLGCTVNTRFDEACPFFITDEQTGDPLVYLVRETVPADASETTGIK